jgi:membrane protease YdiL (CAAX protease family)
MDSVSCFYQGIALILKPGSKSSLVSFGSLLDRLILYARRPYPFVALLSLYVILVYLLAGALSTVLSLPGLALSAIANSLLSLIATVLLARLGWWKEAGFRPLAARRYLLFFWLPFVPVIMNLRHGIRSYSPANLLMFLGLALVVGFAEEMIFRGLILRSLAGRGLWRAAALSALLFGMVHCLNLFGSTGIQNVVLQIGYATAIGFCYAALVLRTGAIWPLIIAHSMMDFFSFIAAGPVTISMSRDMVTIPLLYILAFSVYGAWMLDKKEPLQPIFS